ncbi:hypothetical protein SLS54_006946 [Diplodia seriata]
MEIAGFSIGVLGLAGLFSNAVDCFEYIQLGKSFGTDFGIYQLQLDNARLRLTRWGKFVIVEEDGGNFPPVERDQAKKTMEGIITLFLKAGETSNKFNKNTGSETQPAVYDPDADLESPVLALHRHMRALALSRQKETSLLRKTKWALYERKRFTELLESIRTLLDDLEKIQPARHEAQRSLCDEEVSRMGPNADLPLLESVAAEQDPSLLEAVKRAISEREARLPSVVFSGPGNRGFQLGNNAGTITGFTFG